MTIARFKPGSLIKGRYRVERELGEGGFASVVACQDIELERSVAVKILKIDPLGSEEEISRFRREARLLAQMSHPNIVTVYSFDLMEDGRPFMVMDLLEGRSLQSVLDSEGPLDQASCKSIFAQVCQGLSYAHENSIVHRDLSTLNIILSGQKPNYSVRLIDFGLSKLFDERLAETNTLTETGALLGNPMYMSPELARGQAADARSDIYAVGCLLYQAVSGTPPFEADNPVGLLFKQQNEYPKDPDFNWNDREAQERFKLIILRCLQKRPEDRVSTAAELRDFIKGELHRQSISGSLKLSWSGKAEKYWLAGPYRILIAIGLLLCLAFVFLQPLLLPLLSSFLVKAHISAFTPIESLLAKTYARRRADISESLYRDLLRYDPASLPEPRLHYAIVLLQMRLDRGAPIPDTLRSFEANFDEDKDSQKISKDKLRELSRTLDLLNRQPVTKEELSLRSKVLMSVLDAHDKELARQSIAKLISRTRNFPALKSSEWKYFSEVLLSSLVRGFSEAPIKLDAEKEFGLSHIFVNVSDTGKSPELARAALKCNYIESDNHYLFLCMVAEFYLKNEPELACDLARAVIDSGKSSLSRKAQMTIILCKIMNEQKKYKEALKLEKDGLRDYDEVLGPEEKMALQRELAVTLKLMGSNKTMQSELLRKMSAEIKTVLSDLHNSKRDAVPVGSSGMRKLYLSYPIAAVHNSLTYFLDACIQCDADELARAQLKFYKHILETDVDSRTEFSFQRWLDLMKSSKNVENRRLMEEIMVIEASQAKDSLPKLKK